MANRKSINLIVLAAARRCGEFMPQIIALQNEIGKLVTLSRARTNCLRIIIEYSNTKTTRNESLNDREFDTFYFKMCADNVNMVH